MQHFLGDPDSGMLNLETHRLALAIAKKTLDENRFAATQKMMTRDKLAFQNRRLCFFKEQAAQEMGPQMETWIQNCLHRVQWTFHPHREPGHRKNTILQCHRHHPRTPSRVLEC